MSNLPYDQQDEELRKNDPELYEKISKQLTLLTSIREKINTLRETEREYVLALHEMMPKKKMVFNDFGTIERKNSASRKWDHEEMYNVLVARARDARLIDKETGEVLESEGQAVRRVIEECAGVSYWRLEPLRDKYGIDPDEYATTKWRKSIAITK